MAYALRYYKEITQKDGSVFRLEIHKKDSTASAVEIGAVVQGLSLEIQGQQGEIDTPIIKTSLSMTFVDAGDVEDGRKNGFWEEFYTPDALLWKVILKAKNATENTFRTVWGGYVTPDSYSESLVYRGSVNIIARDNIGHMQDFPFDASGDADGMISLYNLVNAGWEKIASPMSLTWGGEWLYCEGVPAYDTLMNVSAFEGKNWYEAVESALASYSLVMRYVGDNLVQVSSLRSMPGQGDSVDSLPRIEPRFMAGAQRDLIPAVRRIEESVSYDLENVSMPRLGGSAFTGDVLSYRCKIDGVDMGYGEFGTAEHDAPIWPIDPNNGWSDEDDATTLFFNPKAYELGSFAERRGLGDEIYRYMYIAANNVDSRRVSFTRTITCADLAIRMRFGQPCNLDILNRVEQQTAFNLKKITFAVILEQDGITQYYGANGWSASYQELSVEYDPKTASYDFEQVIAMEDNTGVAELTFCIVKIEYAQTAYVGNSSVYGLYACLQDLSIGVPESTSLLKDNHVNSVYNAENNVVLSRTPDFGPAYNVVALPGLIDNGIFYREGNQILPARAWAWSGGTPQQMAVYNHLQLLCYYAKPNNQISGTIVNADLTTARAIYEWHGKEHLLVSGRYDFLTGFIEGAVLREFIRYDDMWGEVSEALLPDTEENSKSNIEAGAGSSGSSSTYTNTTTVNVGGSGGGASYLNDLNDVDVDGATVKSVLYFDGNIWIDKNVATILDEVLQSAKAIAGWFKKDDNGDIYTEVNFYSKKTVASGGKGVAGVGDGSVKGITVNGRTYDAVNGIVTLPSYPTKLSELENDLDLSGGASSWYDIADKPYALQFLGLSSQFIKADGSIDSTSYLPLTGGDVESLTIGGNAAIHAGNIGEYSVGSAAKLQTPRKIWGQSFDGTADITGGLLLGNSSIYTAVSGTNVSLFDFYSDGSPLFGYGTAGIGLRTVICGYNVSLAYGKTRTAGLWLNSSGNVTVGATDKAGEQARLYVDGDIMSGVYYLKNNPTNPYLRLLHNDKNWYIQAYQDAMYIGLNAANALKLNGDGTIYCPNDFQASNAIKAHRHATGVATLNVEEFSATYNGSHLYVTSNNASATYSRPLVLQHGYGNVGIGTLVPEYKLDVSGTGHFSDNVVMDGKLTIGGATLEWDGSALKVTGNMYATGTLATGAKGSEGVAGGKLTADLMPSANNTYNVGAVQQYYKNVIANTFFSGAYNNNLNLLAGRDARIRFGYSYDLSSTTYLGTWNNSEGLVINTKLTVGSIDVGAKLNDLENRLTAIGG